MQAGIHAGVVERHGHLVKIGVAAAFAQAVQGHFQLGGAHKEALHRSGRSHAQVVVAMDRDGNVLGQGFINLLNLVHVQEGPIPLHRIGQVYGGGSRLHHGLQHVNHKIHVVQAVPEVFGAELHVALVPYQGLGQLHALDGLFLHLFRSQVQHMLHGELAGGEEGVDTRVGGVLHRLPAALDIAFHAAGKARDHHLLGNFVPFFRHLGGELGQFLAGFKIHLARGGEPHLGAVHAQFQKLQVHVLFLCVVPGLGQRLVSVTQRDIIKERLSLCHFGSIYFTHLISSPTQHGRKIHFSVSKIEIDPKKENPLPYWSGLI